ncbi:CLUMA_CG017782, isoform A [Clunio marinus]|uniref:CLUMA_CG017782, isoform A n=1 Tax=Clunio marinus TaxID=568069 RepID=A0A1J1IYE4_9DIPT|nr:CLUMA_CG017782, isoform A [Clunio marinus]
MKFFRCVLYRTMAPKSTKAGKKELTTETPKISQAIKIDKNGDISIKVLAKPGSKENGITGITEEGVEIKIAAPPIDGEANTELISYLSKLFNVRKSDLSLDRGSRSRTKTVTMSKDSGLTIDKINDLIKLNV